MYRKFYGCILLFALVSLCTLFASCTTSQEESSKALKIPDFIIEVESGRDPIVLQLSDTQIIDASQQRASGRLSSGQSSYWAKDKVNERCYDYIRETIETTKPDLILITGDLVYGEFDDSGEAFLSLINFMESFEIPWAPVFGNHDNESKKGVDWQCAQLEQAEHCLFKQRTLTGNGNYTVGIQQNGALKRVFFMLDSNGCSAMSDESKANEHYKTSAGFGADQIAWYTETANKIKALSPDTKFTFAFHIQIATFTKAYAKYGFKNSGTADNPINIDRLEDQATGDFGYLGKDLKGAWDADGQVWTGFKTLGVDSILVGHEHCNSASVVYEGVRFQFGQKSSTYDRSNFVQKDGSITGVYPPNNGTPLIGGTVMPLSKENGSILNPYIYLCKDAGGSIDWDQLYKEPEILAPDQLNRVEYDFNGTDFNTKISATGLFVPAFSAKAISDTSTVPAGFTGGVYGNTNNSSEGMATIYVKFNTPIETENLYALKLRMYVTPYTATSGKSPLIRSFTGVLYESLQSYRTFKEQGGEFGKWVEVDILPLLLGTELEKDGKIESFVFTYRYYTSDTTASCYYDSLIIETKK